MNHALGRHTMRTLLKEYLILVTQLEQLQRQWACCPAEALVPIQPAMRTVDILASLGVRAQEGPSGSRCLVRFFQTVRGCVALRFYEFCETDSGSSQKPQLHSLNLSQKEDLLRRWEMSWRAFAQRGQGPSRH